MNNNLKRAIFVLFVVSTLLLMIGSVSANAVDLNENLEASLDLDEGASIDDSPISNPDNKVSNQLTISNIDEETDTTQSVDEDLSNLNSDDVVSNYEDTTINTKDSDKNIKAANNLGSPEFDIQNIPLNGSATVGDDVYFQIIGRNTGSNYNIETLPIIFQYRADEYEYIDYAVGENPYAPADYNYKDRFLGPLNIGQSGDGNNFDQLLFGYTTNYYGNNIFYEGNYFNFTIHLKAKKAGHFGHSILINVSGNEYRGTCWGIDISENDPKFILTNIAVNKTAQVGDVVAFEFFGYNDGGTYTNQIIPISIQYSESEMHCIGYKVGVNPDVPWMDFSGNYQFNSGFDGFFDNIYVEYDCGGSFLNGHCFNFTLYFRVISDDNMEPGCHAYMFTTESPLFTESTNRTKIVPGSILDALLAQDETSIGEVINFANNQKVNFTKTPVQQFVEPGDAVDFVVYLKNIGDGNIQFKNGMLTLYDYYPTDGFEYIGSEIDSESTHPNNIKVNNTTPGCIIITQTLDKSLFAPNEVLKVILHFTAKRTGIICNHLFLDEITESKHITGSVVSGTPDLNLTKTCNESEVELNDDVYFNIYLENNGDFRYYDHTTGKYKLIIQDFYPEGLEFVELVDGWTISQNYGNITVEKVGEGVLNITYTYEKDGTNYDKAMFFEPGSYINLTLKFKAVDYGTWVNTANVYWKYKDWEEEADINLTSEASVVVKPKFTIEKTASSETVKVGDDVVFKIVYTNTGTINLTGVYITDNDYSEGLEYSDYSDKSLWTFDGKDTWHYKGELAPGESAVLELTFKATSPGEKTNNAVGGTDLSNQTEESNDTVLVKDDDANLGSPNDDSEEESEDEPEESPSETPEEEPEETPNDDSVDTQGIAAGNAASPVNKVANIPATGNPLFVLIVCLLSLCFVPLRGKK